MPFTLAGVSINVQDQQGTTLAAPLFFVSAGQINFLLPEGLAPGSATATVLRDFAPAASAPLTIAAVAPALFTANADGRGVAAAYFSTASNPTVFAFTCGAAGGTCFAAPFDLSTALGGAVLVLYGTGLKNNGGLNSVVVTLGGVRAQTLYAGPQNQYPGLDQINVQLPPGLAGRGELDVIVTVNGVRANTVRVAFR